MNRTAILTFRIGLVILLVAATWLSLTPQPPQIDAPDKFTHALAYGVLALFADFAFPRAALFLPKALPLFAYGFLMEILQRYVPGRTYEVRDMVANATGLIIYALASRSLRRLAFPSPDRERGQG